MARATTKEDLIISAEETFTKLNELVSNMSKLEFETKFDFSKDEKKKDAHWSRDKNVRDIYIHLYEWHQLVLNWVTRNMNGDNIKFIPSPYNWKTYGEMNIEFWKKHQDTSFDEAKDMCMKSHVDVIVLVNKFNNEELFKKDVFNWVGGSTLGSYFASATASHYEWAIKKIKAHKKRVRI